MKTYIFTVLLVLLTLPVVAQQPQAKVVLDNTATAFKKAGGIEARFTVKAFNKGRSLGESGGTIQLSGEKFYLKTAETTSWFDGKTQWSYLTANDEVNISTPTPQELQGINPYTLLYLYQKGFSYKLGSTKNFAGTPVYEVQLTATNQQQNLSRILLYVTKDTYQPLYIAVEQRDKSRSEITITGYQAGLKYADEVFVFNRKQYATAEIIDLR